MRVTRTTSIVLAVVLLATLFWVGTANAIASAPEKFALNPPQMTAQPELGRGGQTMAAAPYTVIPSAPEKFSVAPHTMTNTQRAVVVHNWEGRGGMGPAKADHKTIDHSEKWQF